jgi:hypothetical protein
VNSPGWKACGLPSWYPWLLLLWAALFVVGAVVLLVLVLLGGDDQDLPKAFGPRSRGGRLGRNCVNRSRVLGLRNGVANAQLRGMRHTAGDG